MSIRVVGFDISFRTGWAILVPSVEAKYGAYVLGAGVIAKDRPPKLRYKFTKNGVLAAHYVGVEEPFPTKGSGYMIEVSKRVGELRSLCLEHERPLLEVASIRMRSFVQPRRNFYIRCSKCKTRLNRYGSSKKAEEAKKRMATYALKCPNCESNFIPRVEAEGKEPVIAFAQSIEPCLSVHEDDADAIVIALMTGLYANVFPIERLEPWRRELILRMRSQAIQKRPIKRVKRKKPRLNPQVLLFPKK